MWMKQFVILLLIMGLFLSPVLTYAQSSSGIIAITKDSSDESCRDTHDCYDPRNIKAGPGSTLTWKNQDSTEHTVTSGHPNQGPDGFFDSGLISSGDKFTVTLKTERTYTYYCMIHPWMTGSIKIDDFYDVIESNVATSVAPSTAPSVAPSSTLESIPNQIVTEGEAAPPPKSYSEETVSSNESVSESDGGGCLIATATFGSELAPQVHQLRELRDNQLLETESGTAFMKSFNDFYYSFSPIIADYERENPIFREMVKVAITPMLSTLSIMQYAESESEVLGIGIGVILLNLGMYVGIPAAVIAGVRKI